MDCLFELDFKSAKNFGVDSNGLLTCNEKEYTRQHNPYVGVHVENGRITAKSCITNDVLRDLEEKEWYLDALNKGLISSKTMATSQSAILNFGVFEDDEVLKAAWLAQVTRFSEDSSERVSDLLQAKLQGSDIFKEHVKEYLKDMPEFKYPAIKAFDKESFIRMAKIQKEKRRPYIEAINRIARSSGFQMNEDFKILNRISYINSEWIEKLQGQFKRTSKTMNEFLEKKYEDLLKNYGR